MKNFFISAICLFFQFAAFSQTNKVQNLTDNPGSDHLNNSRAMNISAVVTNIGCPGTTNGAIDLTVDGGTSPYSFLWNNGSNTEDLENLTASDNYCVTVTDDQGKIDTACWNVTSLAEVSVQITASALTTCIGDTIAITASSGFSNYLWSTGDTAQAIHVTVAGTYNVTATNSCEIPTSVEQHVDFYASAIPSIHASPTTIICAPDPVVLSLNDSYSTFLWSTGETTSVISIYAYGIYSVTVTGSNNCTYLPSLPVNITRGGIEIIYPDSNNISCTDQPITLNAGCITSKVYYNVEQIPFAPEPEPEANNGLNAGINNDDQVYGPFPIGFNFRFFGNIYSQFYIGSNGWINFSGASGDPWVTTPIPNTGSGTPNNCILGPWKDWQANVGPDPGNYVYYKVYGSAPNRKLVVSFKNIPLYTCNIAYGSFQIVLNEGTNIIDNHLINIPYCPTWNSTHGVQGIQNADGSYAVSVPGRNNTDWTANDESWRYTPNTVLAAWYTGSINSNPISNETQIMVEPFGTYYLTASLGESLLTIDSVIISNYAPLFNYSYENVSCFGNNDGKIELTLLNPVMNVQYQWSNGATSKDIDHLSSGTYSLTISSDSCTSYLSVHISEPPALISDIQPTNTGETGFGSAHLTVSGGVPPYTFHWSTGATTEDVPLLTYGVYYVTITDAIGCVNVDHTFITFGVNELSGLNSIYLFQNYPNPFKDKTEVQFYLPLKAYAELEISNILGEKLGVLVNNELNSGNHSIILDATGYAAGTYFLTLTVGSDKRTRMIQIER
ncbi:MAG: T9SS type A sorting domain-containing protein [Bacteroidia bacterium]|nr:T9SS type A sorting domain-containing protein [Bacteroidia bacterium]